MKDRYTFGGRDTEVPSVRELNNLIQDYVSVKNGMATFGITYEDLEAILEQHYSRLRKQGIYHRG